MRIEKKARNSAVAGVDEFRGARLPSGPCRSHRQTVPRPEHVAGFTWLASWQ